jgi:2-hydroxychromene-2-carboxylate isomerase
MRIQLDCYYSLSSPVMDFAGPQVEDVVRCIALKLRGSSAA